MMRRRTRRRLTYTAAVLAAGTAYSATQHPWLAAATGILVAIIGLARPPKRRRRSSGRRIHSRYLGRHDTRQPNPDLEYRVHALYRAWGHNHVGTNRELIYVGIVALSEDRTVQDRVDEHADPETGEWWWPLEVHHTTAVDYYPTRTAAFAAEAYAIHTEHPRRNLTHRGHPVTTCQTIAAAQHTRAAP